MGRKIKKAVFVAVVIEAIALATTFGLFALHHGREPLEPPFNLIGTLLQMPGLLVANSIYLITAWQNGILILPMTFFVQATIWFAIIFVILTGREKKRKTMTNTPGVSMKPEQAKTKLNERIKQSGIATEDLSLAQGIRLMIDFYRDVRAEGVDLNENGDMLLFQWGTYDWDGTGPTFQCDITRQFIKSGSEGDDGMTQLSFTFHFQPSPEFEKKGKGNEWCHDLKELTKFETFITDSEAFKAVSGAKPKKVDIQYGGV